MFALMKRLSSAVRQLAERHARLKGRAEHLENQVSALTAELTKVRDHLAAVGTLLVGFDSRIESAAIAPIKAWKGKYGQRGALREALLESLTNAEKQWLPTSQIALLLQDSFALTFETRQEFRDWECRSVKSQLRRFVTEGLVEKSRAGTTHSDPACWRLVPATGAFSLDDLRALAAEDVDVAGA